MEQLNIRPLWMPNITCDRCNNFTVDILTHNDKLCTDNDIYFLIVVISFHVNVEARTAIRQSWGSLKYYKGKNIRTLFALGVHDDHNFNIQLKVEQEQYGDILQGNFREDYLTLTNKSMMILQWVNKYCSTVRFLLKTDEDSFNVPQRYLDYLLTVQEDRFVGGFCLTIMPDRRKWSKYYVTKDVYPDAYYPTYCAGPGYILSGSAIRDIHRVAPYVKYLPMEDVYVAGMCRHAAGIPYTQIDGMIISMYDMTDCGLATYIKMGHNIWPGHITKLWERVVAAEKGIDCAGKNTGLLFVVLLMFGVWFKVLHHIFCNT